MIEHNGIPGRCEARETLPRCSPLKEAIEHILAEAKALKRPRNLILFDTIVALISLKT